MNLFRRHKLSQEETDQRLDKWEEDTKKKLRYIEGCKNEDFMGLIEARRKNLKEQQEEYRMSLIRLMATANRIESILSSFRLQRINHQFSNVVKDFMQNTLLMSKDISTNYKKTNIKKVENVLLKTKFITKVQGQELDKFIEMDHYSDIDSVDSAKYQQLEKDVDSMVDAYESTGYIANKRKMVETE